MGKIRTQRAGRTEHDRRSAILLFELAARERERTTVPDKEREVRSTGNCVLLTEGSRYGKIQLFFFARVVESISRPF
jgi:hypothetical protein